MTSTVADIPRCPECGSDKLRNTPPTKDGHHRICSDCTHMWHEPKLTAGAKARAPGGSKGTRRTTLARWTFEEALEHFIRAYPGGFHDPNYARRERDWKWAKHELWRDTVSPGGIATLAKASPDSAANLIEKMMRTKYPMLHPQGEIVPMRDAVHRPEFTARYFSALGDLLDAPSLGSTAFDNYVGALTSLPLIGNGNLAKWTIVTFIPFLAQPSRHMFLKPGRTKEITRRLGVNILYSATPKWDTYERLLTFSNDLLEFLKPHGARDMIDVQSFIWAVTGDYAPSQPPRG
jgi:hypothetical protein